MNTCDHKNIKAPASYLEILIKTSNHVSAETLTIGRIMPYGNKLVFLNLLLLIFSVNLKIIKKIPPVIDCVKRGVDCTFM